VRKHPLLQMFAIGAIATAIGIPLALIIPWFPGQASAQSTRVDTLYDVLLVASVPIFVLVETVVLFSVWKFRMRPGEENKDGPPIHGNTRLEVLWTAAPAILIISLCTYAYTVLHKNEESHKGATTVDVIGEQFAWLFSYPRGDGKAIVSPQLYLAKGRPVVFKVHSRDVIHAFWVPAFRTQLDAVPGIAGTIKVTPRELGNYPVVCAELCGNGHALMRSAVHVLTPSAFQAWLSKLQPIPAPSDSFRGPNGGSAISPPANATSAASPSTPPPAGGSTTATAAAAGKVVFTGVGGCGTCHTLADAATTGTVGPNLGVRLVPDAKKRGKPLNAFILESITAPKAFIAPGFPANAMPQNFAQSLTPEQLKALVAYLASVTK
jgi:cytochrome c oxidase subunit 2